MAYEELNDLQHHGLIPAAERPTTPRSSFAADPQRRVAASFGRGSQGKPRDSWNASETFAREGWVLLSRLRSLFHPAVAVEAMAPKLVDEALFPDELAYIQNAISVRRAEFGAARVCARKALAALGVPPSSLVPNADRSPRWPEGVTGSISHTRAWCAVVVACHPPLRALGLDIEAVRPLDAGVAEMVLTPGELAWVGQEPPERRDELVILFFSAKEAYYKCQYPMTGLFLGFHDVGIALASDRGTFEARALDPRSPAPPLAGRIARAEGLVMCGVEAWA
jgi:4'-phosphopantetheinyl transferase EntD